jgi:MFS family permease
VGLVAVAPLVPRLATRFGGRQTVAVGFAVSAAGFAVIGFAEGSWRYAAFFLPLIAIAVGMGLSNGPSSAGATASVSPNQVGEASGVSNMARYVGSAVATALAATIYGTVTANHREGGASGADALSSGLSAAAWVMAVFSVLGVLAGIAMIRRHPPGQGTLEDVMAAAASGVHTLPTSATPSAAVGEGVPTESNEPGT